MIDRPDETFDKLSQDFDKWPEPEALQNTLLPVDQLDINLIPDPYRDWSSDISFRIQCPIDFPVCASIAMTGSIIGAGCGIKPKANDDWLVVPNQWGAIIGRPSIFKKTPALNETLKPLHLLEEEAKTQLEHKIKEYEISLEVYNAQKKAARDNLHTSVKRKSDLEIKNARENFSNINEPKKPTWRRFRTNDSTIEKMSELLSENPRGILLFRDELTGLLTSWEKEGHEADRAFYLEAWNGFGSNITDRIGRGTVYTENLCISLLGGIQPDKLMKYLHQCTRGLNNDGFMQRLQLAVYPDEFQIKSAKSTDQSPNKEAKNKVCKIIKTLSNVDFKQLGAVQSEQDKIPYFHFSEEAQELFYNFSDELDQKIKNEELPILAEHLGKYRSLMPSLALIFHLINLVYYNKIDPVSFEATAKASHFCDYLESHARRIYGLLTTTYLQAAKKLAEKIQQNKLENGFTIRDIYRNNWHLLNDRSLAKKACEELIDAGWLKKDIINAAFGQKQKVRYFINPKIKKCK